MRIKIIICFLLSILCGALGTLLYFSPLGEHFELAFHDVWFNIRGKRSPPSDIVIVSMDELSYQNLEIPLNQPWPRSLHAKLLERLAEFQAKRVIFDILFLDAGQDVKADGSLEEALHKVPTFLGVEAAFQQVSGAGGAFTLEELLEPYSPFKKAAMGTALVGLPEQSGVIRQFLVERSERTQSIPSLAEAGVLQKEQPISRKPGSRDFINYYGPGHTIPTYSYYQALEDERPFSKSVFQNKTVYVGMSLRSDFGPSKKDLFISPFYNSQIYGVEVHATAASNLIDQSWIRRWSVGTEGIFISSLLILTTFLVFFLSPISGAAVLCIGVIGWLSAAYALFLNNHFLPGATVFLGILPVTYSASTLYSFFVTRRSEKHLRSTFEMYLSPDMVAQLHQKKEVQLGGQKVWATALFTDIEHFTDIAEELPPERAAEMLNEYFTQVMDVVFQNQGTLIKFIGDAVFVIWGAPIHIDNHALIAIQTALKIDREVHKFNSDKKFPELKTRIGIHTGPMLVGNLGSKKRFDYTAIGDAVNIASRIEALNKLFGTSLLFSESVRKDAGIKDGVIPVGTIRVKGKKESVALFTLFDPPPKEEVLLGVEQGLKLLRKQSWEEAISSFRQASELDMRVSGIEHFYRKYIDKVKATGLREDWAGEVEIDSK